MIPDPGGTLAALRCELSSRGRRDSHRYLFGPLGWDTLHQGHGDFDAIAAGHDGVGGIQNQAIGLIESLERVIRSLRLPPRIEDAGVELPRDVVELGHQEARDAAVNQQRLDLAGVAARLDLLARHNQFLHRSEEPIQVARGETLMQAVVERLHLPRVAQMFLASVPGDDLIQVRHAAAAELGNEDLAAIRPQVALPLRQHGR